VIDGTPPERFQIKVGRESKVGHRLGSYWSKHYRDFSPRLIFPTMEKKSTGVPAYMKVERLALLVMADLAQHKAYLDPGSMKAGIPPSPCAKGSKEHCLVAACALFQYLLSHLDTPTDNILQATLITSKFSPLILTQTASILLRRRWFA